VPLVDVYDRIVFAQGEEPTPRAKEE
jgi:hypothetical protein